MPVTMYFWMHASGCKFLSSALSPLDRAQASAPKKAYARLLSLQCLAHAHPPLALHSQMAVSSCYVSTRPCNLQIPLSFPQQCSPGRCHCAVLGFPQFALPECTTQVHNAAISHTGSSPLAATHVHILLLITHATGSTVRTCIV